MSPEAGWLPFVMHVVLVMLGLATCVGISSDLLVSISYKNSRREHICYTRYYYIEQPLYTALVLGEWTTRGLLNGKTGGGGGGGGGVRRYHA